MTTEPQTESGRALLECAYDHRATLVAIEQEAASKAVAEVLDRLETQIEDENDGLGSPATEFALDWARALIASERER